MFETDLDFEHAGQTCFVGIANYVFVSEAIITTLVGGGHLSA